MRMVVHEKEVFGDEPLTAWATTAQDARTKWPAWEM